MERTRLVFDAKEGEAKAALNFYIKRTSCRACKSKSMEPIINLGDQYLPRFVENVDLSLPKAPLQLVRCSGCGLLQLQHTINPDSVFKKYWYRSSVNQTMRAALQSVVEEALTYHRAGKWLDIGANDGYLISQVPKSFKRTACEPAEDFHAALKETADFVVRDYFTHDQAPGPFDVITSVAMFYDIDEPHEFVADIAKSLSPDGIWINQLNDSPTMLRSNDFAAICHEHLCYYDIHSLERIYKEHGLVITKVSFNDVNGGSMRVVARKTSKTKEDISWMPRPSLESCRQFANRTSKWRARMWDLTNGPMSVHGAWIYGASTKGCVMLQYLDASSAFLGIADRNPLKHGLYMSGSWIPIASEETMRQDKPAYLLVLPWPFRDEFLRREAKLLEAGTSMVFPLPNIEVVL